MSEPDGTLSPECGRFREGPIKESESFSNGQSHFEWAITDRRPKLPDSRLRLPHTSDGLYQFEPPRTFIACKAATLRDAMDGR